MDDIEPLPKFGHVQRALRTQARLLARKYLIGQQRDDALEFIRHPHRSGTELRGFVARMRAAHESAGAVSQ